MKKFTKSIETVNNPTTIRGHKLIEQQQIVGYYSICAHFVSIDQLPDNANTASYADAPSLLLGQSVVDRHYQGQG